MPFFERPTPPRDWRFVVGNIGRAFITIGLLMFAFVGYQLWGTGIKTAQAQGDLERQFNELLGSATVPTTGVTPTVPGQVAPPTTIATAPATPIALGSPVAHLRIERINLDWTVVEGVRVRDLQNGPGHFPETPMPGQFGNAAIAGHRTTYGAPFGNLDQLQIGDLIEVGTLAGVYKYSVTGTQVVPPDAYSLVIPTADFNVATLTLSTCTPKYSARQRLIIKAALVPELSAAPMRPAILGPDTSRPTDTGTTPTTLPDETTGSTAVTDNTTDTGTGTGTGDPTQPAVTDSEDAFSQGWFSDRAAIPQAVLWALALLAVVIGSWIAGKRANRLWVCFLVGTVPFVVVLYFFFENVNRLLPGSL
ncbi:MAG: hypothetical protein RLZ14_417 [Actinomycetota bacterium]